MVTKILRVLEIATVCVITLTLNVLCIAFVAVIVYGTLEWLGVITK